VPHTLEVAYVGIEVPDPGTLRPLFTEVVGIVPGETTPAGVSTYRNDDRVHRVLVTAGPANDATLLGVEAADADAFDQTVRQLTGAGWAVEAGDAALAAERRVQRLAATTAPWGVRVELVQGLARASSTFRSSLVPGGFLTEGVGFGHAVFATEAFDEADRFLTEGLGFAQSDWLEMEIARDVELEVRFYHCNQRHHSVAIARAPFPLPQTLHHLMFETKTTDDTGHAFDRAWAAGLPLPNGLGRHDNDGMFSFYVQGPAGFRVEVGHGAKVVTPDWDGNRLYDRISAWGHQPLRTA
jgi:2,3-dihydroxybiphenyl 1,2-dioxygenase